MNTMKKVWMPWTAAEAFPSEEEFQRWLEKCRRRFDNLRILSLVAAAGLLIVGYVLDRRPVMLLTVLPLLTTWLLTTAMDKTEAAMTKK